MPRSLGNAFVAEPPTYTLFAGLYDLTSGQRLHLLDASGRVAPPDEMRLGDVEVTPRA